MPHAPDLDRADGDGKSTRHATVGRGASRDFSGGDGGRLRSGASGV